MAQVGVAGSERCPGLCQPPPESDPPAGAVWPPAPVTAEPGKGSAVPDAVEGGVRAGGPAEAGERLAIFRGWAERTPTRSRQALLARCQALLGERPTEQAFAEAIELADALAPIQRARTELLFGEWLRRERRRQEARVHLRAALELFRGLGTVPWEARAEAELPATGATPRNRDVSAVEPLTPHSLP